MLCAGCSTDNITSGSQTQVAKPPPQVRVVAAPSATATIAITEEAVVAPTSEATATSAQVYVWPTPDEDAILNQIDTMIEDINQKLNSQDLLLKP